jgi:hydrogenase expression/formation protein HypC
MCLAIPGQIVKMLPGTDLATADVSGVKRNINIGLVEPEGIAPGDWVLIHVGFAMSKIDENEARTSLEFLKSMGQAFTDEIEAMQERPPQGSG